MRIIMYLDGGTMRQIARLKDAPTRINTELEQALDDLAKGLQDNIPAQMQWKNPSGALAGSFTTTSKLVLNSRGAAFIREVGSELPYSRRREFGFTGRTDSLGRKYTNDPGAFYMQAAIGLYDTDMLDRIGEGVDKALAP